MNLENMQNLYVLFDVTWHKNGKSYVIAAGISIRNILKSQISMTSGSKVMAQTVVFVFLVTLTLTFDMH